MVAPKALAVLFFAALSLFVASALYAQAPSSGEITVTTADAPLAMDETPTVVINESMFSYHIANSKLFWHTLVSVTCDPDVSNKEFDEFIRRWGIQGSNVRDLFAERSKNSFCSPTITSNIVADSDNVYFVRGALYRMSVLANPGDLLPTISADISGRSELLISGANLYVLTENRGLWRIDRQTFEATRILTAAQVGADPVNFQSDGKFAYWLLGGQLRQVNLTTLGVLNFGATTITNYYPYTTPCLHPCEPIRFVYMGVGTDEGSKLRRFDSNTRLFNKDIWTIGSDDTFDEIVVAGNHVFFVEEQAITCEPFCSHTSLLKRMERNGNGTPELIYQGVGALVGDHTINQLTANGVYLYWIDGFTQLNLKRLAQDAAALPMTNMRVTNLEVTQAIQNLDHDVPIIERKRTFVRVHFKSDGDPVEHVTAHLYRLNGQNGTPVGEPLSPVNPVGQYLTAVADPNRALIDQSFLFELPMEWVEGTGSPLDFLHLRAEINPYKTPPQTSYANNEKALTIPLAPSPRFDIRFVLFRYVVSDVLFEPDWETDFRQTVSWIRRAYPIASVPTNIGGTSPGFGPGYTYITDNDLKDYITQGECDFDDDMCASDYVHGLLEDWDDDWQYDHAMMYGMMPIYTSPYSGKRYFPRGSASGDTANGPSGDAGGKFDWDIDGTIADWYGGHEIGHLIDRDHPTKGGDPDVDDETKVGCGHTQDDDDYPYSGARIDGSSFFGFDPGNPENSAIMTPTVMAGDGAFDVMSYCHPIQWVSDYTYEGMYFEMFDLMAAQAAALPTATGEYLYLNGVIKPDEAQGHFVRVRRKNGEYTPTVAGTTDYAIKLLDSGGGQLALVDVPAIADKENPGRLLLQADLAWVNGTRTVQLIHKPSSAVYISHSFSTNPPVLNNVNLVGATNPVSGTVTLSWEATDADNDALIFDLHYSIDNGASFQPLQAGLTGSSTQINTLELGGSSQALFRVTAFDGGNTTTATTPPFVLANKPPTVFITNPADGTHVQYGQLVNFIGEAWDPQWQEIAESDLRWSRGGRLLPTGMAFSTATLEVGEHQITFTAKNAAGLEASTTITIFVDDDLNLPGATLQVAPNQIGLHFEEGDTTPQLATLSIANVGSNSFSWTASTNVPWLTLSSTEGSAPAKITVTADPAQISDNASATITVVASVGGGGFTVAIGKVEIPVYAVFGDGATPAAFPGAEANTRIHLPAILAEE